MNYDSLEDFIEYGDLESGVSMTLYLTHHGDQISITDGEQSVIIDADIEDLQ